MRNLLVARVALGVLILLGAWCANAEAKFVTINGRTAAGYFGSNAGGAYDTASFRIPDVRFVFVFNFPADIKATYRLSLNNNAFNTVDYLFFDVPLAFLGIESVNARLGQFKNTLSVEGISDNLIQQWAANNSAGMFVSIDRGIEFSGKTEVSNTGLAWTLAVTEGTNTTGGAGADLDSDKALTLSLCAKPTDALTVAAYGYRSGDLGNGNSAAASVGGSRTAPGTNGLRNWERQTWLIHAEYAMGKTKLRASYGEFEDDSSTLAGIKGTMKGSTWMAGFLYDLTEKVFLSGMWSRLDMDGDYLFSPSGGASGATVASSELRRTELALGYKLAESVKLKYAWTDNKRTYTSAQRAQAGFVDVDDDQHAAYFQVLW